MSGEQLSNTPDSFRIDQISAMKSLNFGTISEILNQEDHYYYTRRFSRNDQSGYVNIQDNSHKTSLLLSNRQGIDIILVTSGVEYAHWDGIYRELEAYYIIDTVTQRSTDISSLWRDHKHIKKLPSNDHFSSLRVYIGPEGRTPHFGVYREGAIISLFDPESDVSRSSLKFSVNNHHILTTLHEIGHAYQFGKLGDSSQFRAKKKGEWHNIAETLIRMAPVISTVLQSHPDIKAKWEKYKYQRIMLERNAFAFAFGVIRHMRQNGIDIYRGQRILTARQGTSVIDDINSFLATYDTEFKYISGPKASKQIKRAKE